MYEFLEETNQSITLVYMLLSLQSSIDSQHYHCPLYLNYSSFNDLPDIL